MGAALSVRKNCTHSGDGSCSYDQKHHHVNQKQGLNELKASVATMTNNLNIMTVKMCGTNFEGTNQAAGEDAMGANQEFFTHKE